MKKLFFAILALMMCVSANAFEFDGVDLNGSVLSITRNISMRGYITDTERNCLKGRCMGKEIYMSLNTEDVTQKGRLGQLIVDVPMKQANFMEVATETLNVIYHQIEPVGGLTTYLVDNDGTILTIQKTAEGIKYVFTTPFYKSAK